MKRRPRPGAPTPVAHTSATVQVRAIARHLALATRAGLAREELIQSARLTEVDFSDPDARLPLSAEVALWQMIAKGVPDPGFGVRAGASLDLRDAGLLGYIMAHSATLGDALRRMVRYSRLLSEAVEFEFEEPGRPYAAIAEVRTALGAGLQLAVDFRIATALSACRQITGVDLVPLEIAVTYAQPASILEHRRVFRCPLRFSQPVTRVLFHERELSLPVVRSDETLVGYLSEHAERVLRSLVTGPSTRERVRAAIWSELSEGRPNLPGIAAALGVPARTLQRQLAVEHTSLQAEIDDIRKAMALAALNTRNAPVEDIAFLLGYAETSTFFRAFKRWTGTTPDRFRRQLADAPPADYTSIAPRG